MARSTDTNSSAAQHASHVMNAWAEGTVSTADILTYFQDVRAAGPEATLPLDEMLLRQISSLRGGLLEARSALDEMQTLVDRYGAAPLIPGVYLYCEETPKGSMALVSSGPGRRAVALAQGFDASKLHCGDPIYISADMSVLVTSAKHGRLEGGETATFERYTSDGRIVLRSRTEEQFVVEASAALDDTVMKQGDTVRWDRIARLCVEKMDDAERNPYLLEQVEDIPMDSIGGQRQNLRQINEALLTGILYPERAKRYFVSTSNTLLLYGPPGNGKTSMTRAAFSNIQRISGKKVYLSVVKGSQLESMWVGQTQANITALFSNMRTAAQEGNIAVLFIDEIDSVGRIRGGVSGHHSDKALGTLLNELNGFQELRNVSVVGACNRKDLLDAALVSRFGEEIQVRRPDRRGAREIFEIHMQKDAPYSDSGCTTCDSRLEMIDMAVSRLYGANIGAELCTLKFRDGKTRPVMAAEMVSGRLIQQISQSAKKRAIRRENETGEVGIRVEDMDDALCEVRERLSRTLSPHNAHNYLDTLAADEVVLDVEPIVQRVQQPRRYLSIA